jgi:hypothetical protein
VIPNNHTIFSVEDGTTHEESIFDQIVGVKSHDERMFMAAAYYAHHGIPIFPFWIPQSGPDKGRKKPCVKDWPNTATTDLDRIKQWWGAPPDDGLRNKDRDDQHKNYAGHLIGAVVGERSGWCVLDIDVKNGGKGMQSLATLADEIAPIVAESLTYGGLAPEHRLAPVGLAKTRSGGLHLWYPLGEHAAVLGVGKIRGLDDIEFKATGQFVALAPSTGYSWLKQLPVRVNGTVSEYLSSLSCIGEQLLDRVTQKAPKSQSSSRGSKNSGINLERYLNEGIPRDEIQDEALRDIAASLAGRGYLEHQIVDTLQAIVAVTLLTRPDEPWTDHHLEDKASRAIEFVARERAKEAAQIRAVQRWALSQARPLMPSNSTVKV